MEVDNLKYFGNISYDTYTGKKHMTQIIGMQSENSDIVYMQPFVWYIILWELLLINCEILTTHLTFVWSIIWWELLLISNSVKY
jgi:hypothetical protein